MQTRVLYAGRADRWDDYRAALNAAFAAEGIEPDLVDRADPATVDYIVYAPNGPVQDFAPCTRLKAIFSLWVGVENVAPHTPPGIPLARMVDPGITQGMTDYVVGHALYHHLRIDRTVHEQDGTWRNATRVPPLSSQATVAMLGLGQLGLASARALAAVGFRVIGWARRDRHIDGIETHAGGDGLYRVLAQADVVVTLLPLTDDTRHTLDAKAFAAMKPGAVIINPGRGPLIDDDAMLAALANGTIRAATLDVFATEPLPPDHPYWDHPAVLVTPHIGAETRVETASQSIAANLRRAMAGEPILNLVDRVAGY